MGRVDPFALLGVSPDVSPEELARAYHRLAKEWHPDHQATSEAAWRMAQINAAYEAAREAVRAPTAGAAPETGTPPRARARPRPGAWLDPAMRRSLGPELVRSLHDREPVQLVVPTSTWASPQARLAVTDRRLLWLLEDAVGDRVRSLRFPAIAQVDHRLAWPRRRTATVRLRTHQGRRIAFADLAPATAEELVGHVRGRLAA